VEPKCARAAATRAWHHLTSSPFHHPHHGCSPQNVLLTANGAVRLGDVGFSKLKEKTFITHGKTQSSCMCAAAPLALLGSAVSAWLLTRAAAPIPLASASMQCRWWARLRTLHPKFS